MGSDGGLHQSYDGGTTCVQYSNIPFGEFYAIGVDMEDPYNVYGGLQDHESWKGPSNGWTGKVTLADWFVVGSGDGAYNVVDPTDSRWLFNSSTGGSLYRVDQKLGAVTSISPRREGGNPPYRFVWNTPLHLSPHNSQIVYAGAQVLLRSLNRGDTWQEISPDVSTNDASKMGGAGAIPWFAITTISESPITAGVIWVGTSDGKVQVTRNAGATWTDLTAKITALGGRDDAYVSRVFASSHQPGTAYVAKSGYRNDDFRPFVYKTTDFGATWTPLGTGLPNQPVNVVVEDRKNPNLLFVGTDAGVHVSIDGGGRWVRMNNNIPNVPVHDLVIHPRENDLVVGTYGRGLFVTDITPLQEMTAAMLATDAHLFQVEPRAQRHVRTGGDALLYGDTYLATSNEPNAVVVNYYVKGKSSEKAKVTVTDLDGAELATLEGPTEAGINTVLWDMRRPAVAGARASGTRDPFSSLVPPGEYVVRLDIGAKRLTERVRITKRMGWPIGPITETYRE
jgi:photosystem II stability/assembly factor-like uncharacterized protein